MRRSSIVGRRRERRRRRRARQSAPSFFVLARLLETSTLMLLLALILALTLQGMSDALEFGSWGSGLLLVAFVYWLKSIYGVLVAQCLDDEPSPFVWGAVAMSAVILAICGYVYAAGGMIFYYPESDEFVWRLLSDGSAVARIDVPE